MNRHGLTGRVWVLLIVTLIGVLCLAGCGGKKEQTSYNNRGMDDGVDGFLFNFDQRAEVTALVNFYKKKQFPVSVTWSYDKSAPENQKKKRTFKSVTSDDPDRIQEIYFALSNTIVMGVATDQTDDVKYFVSFTLPDDTVCRFDFVTENTIRIGNQNYVAESDGYLWNYLNTPDEAGTESVAEELLEETETGILAEELLEETETGILAEELLEETVTGILAEELLEETETGILAEELLEETVTGLASKEILEAAELSSEAEEIVKAAELSSEVEGIFAQAMTESEAEEPSRETETERGK